MCQETRPWPCGSPSEHLRSPQAFPCSLNADSGSDLFKSRYNPRHLKPTVLKGTVPWHQHPVTTRHVCPSPQEETPNLGMKRLVPVPLPASPWQPPVCILSPGIYLFRISRRYGITQHDLCARLLSLMLLRHIPVVAHVSSSFPFTNE